MKKGVEEGGDEDGRKDHPGVGICMSPFHADKQAVFVKHAEERLSWERVIAGQNVNVDGGVPVLWRGCSLGCLDFLNSTADSATDAS